MNYILATLKQSKNDWYVYYSYRNPETDLLEPFKIRGGINRIKSKKEKVEYGKEMVLDVNERLKSGWSPFISKEKLPYHGLSLLEIFDQFKKTKGNSSLKPRTILAYKYGINKLTAFLKMNNLLEIAPERFTKSMAKSFSDFLCNENNLKPKTHNNLLLLVGVLFNLLEDHEIIIKSPFKHVRKLREAESDYHEPFTKPQREEIKEYLQAYDPNLFLLCQFIFYCFIRRTELVKTQVKHIDWDNSRLRIPGGTGKNSKRMSVEIPPVFFIEVKKNFYGKNPENYLFGKGLKCCATKTYTDAYTNKHRAVLDVLGMGKMNTLYGHKHTGAIAFINAGGSEQALMIQMRHHSIEQTRTYLRKLGMIANTEFSLKMTEF